ncbi:diacylglycerol/lipid kinase family protein [Falsiroseomonas sp. HW251]|uniref:diacylglycerol/lipid kinase family protein n=1 Tax=Falsiroseomonas sp. HW251 TaxID=3390998 RepID=UPI003D318D5C
MPSRIVIIFNPAAGTRRRRRLDAALDLLRGVGLRPEVLETARPGDAMLLAGESAGHGGTIVAAGGDGTIAEVAAGIRGSDAALGVLPLGTANVFALELGIPLAPKEAAVVLAMGRTIRFRPGIARRDGAAERPFVQMVGAGLDAAVVRDLPPRLKRMLGKGAYVLQTLREIGRNGFAALKVVADGVERSATSVVVTKGRLYAGRFVIAPDADARGDEFRVVALRQCVRLDALRHAAALPLGLLPGLREIRVFAARHVRIEGAGGPLQADGDAAGILPVEIAPSPTTIRIVVP